MYNISTEPFESFNRNIRDFIQNISDFNRNIRFSTKICVIYTKMLDFDKNVRN